MLFKNTRKNHVQLTFKYLTADEILYKNNLIDQILKSFEKNHFTFVVFINLSKVFNTTDHLILIKKLNQY